ncbi:hypothetical protein TREMEDRAFT_57734 [Tremella mesenterica DSM 1558]|nr:uncharacterized protein TREMEDRAFT_57734 [Tremella mesenterica DSM 1558]EIW66545.1 hypothetical protein TREMEDRAFT_57734 [Tremella mesenterica DSM 1558]
MKRPSPVDNPDQMTGSSSPIVNDARSTSNAGNVPMKNQPKCLGCGATETPEWRRGPMGPRTLCNACGLVHMKLQRKKRKLEEKAAGGN